MAFLCADMSDMLEDADEVNEIMGRAYGSITSTARSMHALTLALAKQHDTPLTTICCLAECAVYRRSSMRLI